MSYNIEPVFILYPLACLLFYALGVGNRKPVKWILAISFILLYSFSLNGSDLEGYRILYRGVGEGASASALHGELGYYFLVKAFVTLGCDYLTYRIVLLTVCSLVLFYCFAKMSDNFALSTFFLSTMFVVYTISAYRQYIVIAFSIWCIYNYDQGKRKRSLIGLSALVFFHITAILPLFLLLFYSILSQRKTAIQMDVFQNHYLKILGAALVIRVMITIALLVPPFRAIVSRIVEGHASPDPTLFSFGLVSRVVLFFCISYIYKRSEVTKTSVQIIYWYYYISILLYIMIPLEFTMGRLINNANILLCILIPALRFQYSLKQDRAGIVRLNGITSILLLSICVALFVLVNQLLHQDGYTPYLNYLRGDESVIFRVEEEDEPKTPVRTTMESQEG